MRRFRFSVVVAVAFVALVMSAVGLGVVTPVLIQDAFTGTSIDSKVWVWYGTGDPDNVDISQAKGALTISVSAAAKDGFNAGLGTRCKAHGDFDARLAFNLVSWPEHNGVWVSLNTADTGGFNTYRVSWDFGLGDDYGVYLPGSSGGGNAAASEKTGELRLTRQGNIWRGYYLSDLGWVQIGGSGEGPTSDIQFNPSVFNLSNVLQFGGKETTVEFRKFKVVADRVIC